MSGQPYRRSAAIYDAIYRSREPDRAALAERTLDLAREHGRSGGRRLLDVGCGTGADLPTWRRAGYTVEGVDLSAEMLEVAQARCPEVPLHQGDMATFDLGRRFDAVVCMGSSIGYTRTPEGLDAALANLARHAAPGGVVVVHAWIAPDDWRAGKLTAELVDEPELKVAQLSRSSREGDVSVVEFHYLVLTPAGAESYVERHEMGLFAPERYRLAFERAGLDVVAHDPAAGGGRGLHVGRA